MPGIVCHCGSTASIRPNSLLYNGKSYGNGRAWICDRFPMCRGSVGCHPDGRPLGTIPDKETKKLRIEVHALVDVHWKHVEGKKELHRARAAVYGWLRRIMDLEPDRCHIGMFSKDDCIKALRVILQNPFLTREENEARKAAKREVSST